MRKCVLISALAVLLVLLNACAENNSVKSGASASTASESPDTVFTTSEATSSDVQSSAFLTKPSTSEPQIPDAEDIPDAAPQVPANETASTEPSPSPEKITAPASTAGQASVTDAPQNSTGEQPPLMTKLIQGAGLSFDDLSFSQLVIVAAEGSFADIYCYDKSDSGQWILNEEIGYIKGYAGRNGVNSDKHEGDGCSPAGLFRLGYAFGNNEKPSTGMEYRPITENTYWIDDPNSKYYNQWVEGTDNADWSGAEHLSENIVSYAYAVAIDYNTAPNTVAGKGSAIFFHIGSKPTSGCVVVSEETLLTILKWLSQEKSPSILITAQ